MNREAGAASYDKPALPHFTGRGDLINTAGWFVFRYATDKPPITDADKQRWKSICCTLATADTPPEEMR